jgi:O-antigen ligase
MRRFELEVLGFGVLILALFVPLVLFVSSAYLLLGLMLAAAWMFLYMPFWRRRVRRAAAEAPQWDLRPE